MDELAASAAALAGSGVWIARAWGTRESLGRGRICCCNADRSQCRVGLAGRHPVHALTALTATRDLDVILGWRRAFGGENMLALCGARSRLAAVEVAGPEALQRAQQRHGALPITPTVRAPDGTLTALYRWGRPPLVDPAVLGVHVRVLAEGAHFLVPGSRLIDGEVAWAVPPADARLAGLPLSWRSAILDAPRCRVFRAA